jgi:hypothetical protein
MLLRDIYIQIPSITMNKNQLEQLVTRIIKEEMRDDNVKEIFGLSQKEKDAKATKADIEKAKAEIDKISPSYFFVESQPNDKNKEYIAGADRIRGRMKEYLPTFVKLFPEVIEKDSSGTGVCSTRYNYQGKVLSGYTLANLSHIITPKYTDNIDDHETKEHMKKYIDDKFKNIKEEMGGSAPKKKQKIDPKYTHFLIRKNSGKIINGWDYKGLDNDSIKYYVKGDLHDFDVKPGEVKLLTAKALKQKGTDPFDSDNWEKLQEAKGDTEIITTSDGSIDSADSKTKNKVKQDAQDGTAILVKRKGQPLAENSEEMTDDSEEENTSIAPVRKSVQEAITTLESMCTTCEGKHKSNVQNAVKYLKKAESHLASSHELEEKANAKKAAEAEKEDGKHSDQVFKHISKKLNGKNKKQDIEPIKTKYDKVAKKLRTKRKQVSPERDAEDIWKHMLKENTFVQMPAGVKKNTDSKIDTTHPIKVKRVEYSNDGKPRASKEIVGKIIWDKAIPSIKIVDDNGSVKLNVLYDDKGFGDAKAPWTANVEVEPIDNFAKQAFDYLKSQSNN